MTEKHSYTSRFHRLKTVFAGGHKLVVPEGWVDDVTPGGAAWVGDPDDDYALQMVSTAGDVAGGAEARARAMAARANELVQGIGDRGQVGDIAVSQSGPMLLIKAVTDDPRMPDRRIQSWIRLQPYGEGVAETSFHLIVRFALWDRPQTKDLIELFEAQLRNNSPREQAVEGRGFDRLRTFRPYGFLTLQVPARWRDELDAEAEMWFCGVDEPEKIILWTAYDIFRGEEVPSWANRMAEELGNEVDWRPQKAARRRYGYQTMTKMGELGYPVRFHRWIVLDWQDETALIIQFTLILRAAWEGDPEFDGLVASMERQMGTLVIGPVPEETAVSATPSDRKVRMDQSTPLNFDHLRTITPFGFLTLQVPARWRDERDAESGEWFCGEDETDTGTLWIDYDSFAGQFDQRGPERLVQKLGNAVAWRPPGEGWRRVGHQSFTEDAAVRLRFHRWFVIDWTATRAVMVTLTLTLQAAWDDEPDFQRLVGIVEQQAAMLSIGTLPG